MRLIAKFCANPCVEDATSLRGKRAAAFEFLARTPGAALPLQGGSRVLKERVLPLVKHRRMDPLLLADLADRHVFQKMQSENLRLLFRIVSPARSLAYAPFPRVVEK
jgi:hypothetical protein